MIPFYKNINEIIKIDKKLTEIKIKFGTYLIKQPFVTKKKQFSIKR